MKGRIGFEYDTECQRVQYLFEEGVDGYYDYSIFITLPEGRKINITKLKQGLNKYFLRKLTGKQYQKDFPDRVEIIKNAYDNDLDLVDNCDEVRLYGTTEIPIEDYPDLDKKQIILSDVVYPVDIKVVEELEKKYKGFKNIYIKVTENDDLISLEDYRKTAEVLTDVVNKIKSYNLSPLEQIIYAYDYARDKLYKEVNPEESNTKSRDLTHVLLTDKIVCVGYARIFSTILNMLGIRSSTYQVTAERPHRISIAHIQDEKYGIDGIYYFDPTMDRKKDDTNNHFDSYLAFAKTLEEMMSLGTFKDETFGHPQEDYFEAVINAVKNNETTYRMSKDYRYIANMSRFMEGRPVESAYGFSLGNSSREEIYSNPNVMTNVKKCFGLLDSSIDPVILTEAVANVRKVQYYENSDKFRFSSDTLSDIASNSRWYNYYSWNYDPLSKMIRDNEESYDKDRAGIDLVKVLRKVKEQKETQ